MAKLTTIHSLLVQEINDIYSAETQLVKALPKRAGAASDPELRKGFQNHLKETKTHVSRLERVAKMLEASPRGKSCKAMKGLIDEGSEVIKKQGEPFLKDLALITAAQKVEHYEIAGYRSARAIAEALGLHDVVEYLQATLDEEGATDRKLTAVAAALLPHPGKAKGSLFSRILGTAE